MVKASRPKRRLNWMRPAKRASARERVRQLGRQSGHLRVANSVGHLASILLGALQQGPLEERLARLEAALLNAGTTEQ
jgi:hypothetical protein